MWLNVENSLGMNTTLLTAAGEFRYPDSDKLLKAVCLFELYLYDRTMSSHSSPTQIPLAPLYRPTTSHTASISWTVRRFAFLTLSTAST